MSLGDMDVEEIIPSSIASDGLEAVRSEVEAMDEAHEALRKEKALRETIRKKPTVLTWEPRKEDIEKYPFRPLEGTVMLFWSITGTELINDLETAIVTRNLEQLDEIGQQILEHEAVQNYEIPSVDEAVERGRNAPALFDFSVGSRELYENVFLADVPMGAFAFPYTGGEIDPDAFSILEYPCVWPEECPPPCPGPFPCPWPEEIDWPDGPLPPDGPYDYLVVVTPPDLTEVERRAMETIPPDVREANVIPGREMVAGLVAVVVYLVVSSAAPNIHDDLGEITLPDRMMDELGARPAVGQLLDMRREVLEDNGIR